jgi:hypothetical protein
MSYFRKPNTDLERFKLQQSVVLHVNDCEQFICYKFKSNSGFIMQYQPFSSRYTVNKKEIYMKATREQ